MSSYKYRKSHCGDKTVVRSSYLHNEIFYTSKVKMTSLYWIGALVLSKSGISPQSIEWAGHRPTDAIWRRWSGSTLGQVMACCLLGTKPFQEPVLIYRFLKNRGPKRKCIWKYRLQSGVHFVQAVTCCCRPIQISQKPNNFNKIYVLCGKKCIFHKICNRFVVPFYMYYELLVGSNDSLTHIH